MKSSAVMLLFFLSLCACKSAKVSTAAPINNNFMKNDYYALKSGENLYDFVDKKICFEAKISEIPAQHMMKFSLDQGEKEKHEYLDPDPKYKSYQVVGYYYQTKVQFPENKKAAIKVYGSVKTMSGKGKGGGTHTEYYLDLDKVESLD